MDNSTIAHLRKDYTLNGLRKEDVLKNPIDQFKRWFSEALASHVLEANGMVLSTIGRDGYPHGRVVLLKEVDTHGFSFYTNYLSQKGDDLAHHSVASLTFWWPELERQVRIVGKVEKVETTESDTYFATRPRGSQIGAWVSEQSQTIPSRKVLEEKLASLEEQFENQVIARPPHWGGYRVLPHQIEFWQGRPSRLHDRLCYTYESNDWKLERLSP